MRLWFYKLLYKYHQSKTKELSNTADEYYLAAHASAEKVEKARSKILDLGGKL